MITIAGWGVLLVCCCILAWRAVTDGRVIWAAIGGIGLCIFGLELAAAAVQLVRLIESETALAIAPRLQWHVIAFSLAVFMRRRRPDPDPPPDAMLGTF